MAINQPRGNSKVWENIHKLVYALRAHLLAFLVCKSCINLIVFLHRMLSVELEKRVLSVAIITYMYRSNSYRLKEASLDVATYGDYGVDCSLDFSC